MTSEIQYIFINTASESSWTDDVPAIASGIIALLALFATVYQSHLSRKHNRLSIRPHLAIHGEEGDDCTFTVIIRNDGLGPANIEDLKIYRDGKKLDASGEHLITKAFEGLEKCELKSLEAISPPFILPANHSIKLATIGYDESIDSIDEHLENILRLEIPYTSSYGEKFKLDTDD
ncbi:hypothetical protein NOV18_10250 [Pseudomonas asiatica]|uniref:Uncharacterized protein n=1 Tax=Pseudomonas asiatica TaxID=2219225 RepID=A0AAJ5LEL0_9PSED|nr:hypothetical protein [Pseudomonas asiatica]UUC20832.1 hypothetical protein NOV18_10250 [Pseudomonas asiatica]